MPSLTAQMPAPVPRAVDIVVRVDRDREALARCLDRVFGSASETPFDVLLWPASLESDAQEIVRGASYAARVSAVGRGEPLGRTLGRHRERDIVLLALHAEVQGDWLDRLAFHARGDRVGVVGTISNAGGAAAYPRPGTSNALPAGETPATLDALAARANAQRAVDVDAIDGPCLYLTREAVDAIGDTPIGDDEDGAARTLASAATRANLRLQVAGDVFVARRGSGAACRSALPRNPVVPLLRRLDLARLAASPRPLVVFVSHAWGGGIRRHMNDLAALVSAQADVLYLTPDGDAVELWWPREGEAFAAWFRLPADMASLAAMLRGVGAVRLHFHHVHGLPPSILDLPRELGVPYDCTLHDYYAICPQYHLSDERGRYCGEPDRHGCKTCLAHRHAQWPLDIDAWRSLFARFLEEADRVIAPSHDVEARMRRYFPALPITVWPHPETVARIPPAPIRVATLGSLSPEKGLHVVTACAEDAHARGLPIVFHVLGATSQPIVGLPAAPVRVHGSYDEDALPAMLAAERPDVLFFPSQVPETYAYTLSVALASDLPIVASALGAFPERLAARPRVRLVPFDASPARWNDALLDAVRRDDAPAVASTPDGALHAAS